MSKYIKCVEQGLHKIDLDVHVLVSEIVSLLLVDYSCEAGGTWFVLTARNARDFLV